VSETPRTTLPRVTWRNLQTGEVREGGAWGIEDEYPPLDDLMPKHAAGLTISHNDHKGIYQSAADWAAENDERRYADWVSDEERAKAIATDSIWTVQWYPNTPVGFNCVAASTLEAALKAARED
jgi:hypothetical protein